MGVSDTVRTIISRAHEEHITFFASSIAYYAFFSIIPLLLLTLSIGSLIGGEAFAERIVAAVEEHLSSSGQEVISQAIENSSGQIGASIAGLVGLVWSAIKVIRAIDVAFDEIYASTVETSLTRQIRNGLTVLGLIGTGITVMVAVGAVIQRPTSAGVPYINLFSWLVLITGLVIVFLPLYYVMPPQQMTISKAFPGTVVAAVGWIFLQAGFQLYSSHASNYEAYGLIGGILLFLTWLYFAGILLLFGAVVNAVLEQDRERMSPNQDPSAPTTE